MVAGFEVFEYVEWFEDPRMHSDDEDREWPAVFLILALSADDAQRWGDRLAHDRAARTEELFLRSSVKPHVCVRTDHDLPTVPYGTEASDELIGW